MQPAKILKILTLLLFSSAQPLALAIEDTKDIYLAFEKEQTQSNLYHYGWLSIYTSAGVMSLIRANDASTYAYKEAFSLRALRSLLGTYSFLAKPVESLGAHNKYKAIIADKSLSSSEQRKRILSLADSVAKDQQKRLSMRGLYIGTIIHVVVSLRVLQKTKDRYFAGRVFLSGMTSQLLAMKTVPTHSLNLSRSKENLQAALLPDPYMRGVSLSLKYQF